MKTINVVKSFDLFAQRPSLYLNGNRRIGSVFGTICSLAMLVLIAVYTYVRVQKVIAREITQVDDLTSPLSLNKSNIFFNA
jgi:hypothetical protein